MAKREFTFEEQIACIDRQIGFQERVIKTFENDDPSEVSKAKEELECLKSIRETLESSEHVEEATKVFLEALMDEETPC